MGVSSLGHDAAALGLRRLREGGRGEGYRDVLCNLKCRLTILIGLLFQRDLEAHRVLLNVLLKYVLRELGEELCVEAWRSYTETDKREQLSIGRGHDPEGIVVAVLRREGWRISGRDDMICME